MKKILKFTKRNLKVIVAFIIGIMFSGTFVYATSSMLYASSEVEYDNTTVAIEKEEGVNVANVQEAIEALYEKASNASTDCAQGYVKQNVTSTSYVCGPPPPPTAAETISTKEGIETVSYGKIYTGASPDNYVLFNCTNDSDESTCEEWRIIGVYTDAT